VEAGRTRPVDLNDGRPGMKASPLGGVFERLRSDTVFDFGDATALPADQELSGMIVLGVTAGHEGVESLDLVDQPLLH
jgi:hypothetical protein